MNSAERWEKIKNVFESALSRTGGERRAYLEGACGGDGEMLREVESLLSSFDADYLEGAAVDQVADAFVSKTAVELKPGTMIGQYRVIAELGKGGQGAVYKAEDTNLHRIVAIKTLPPELMIDDTARKRFQREARLASSLDHPNICAIHDLAERDGMHFIVMQYVDGKNARELVNGKPLELTSALRIGIQVCDALAAAHDRGIIHRDIKAHNIIVTDSGTAKVLDFGLARITKEGADENTELTALGSPYGTPTYAAPEQSRGEKVDTRADIFSTGVLLYEMLTGTWAFHGKTAIDVRHAVLYEEPKSIAERRGESIPEELEALVNKALAKDPADRYARITDLRDGLVRVLRGETDVGEISADEVLDRFETVRPRHFVSSRTKARRLVAAATLAAIIVATGGFLLYRRSANLTQAALDAVRVGELTKERRYFEAYDLAQHVLAALPDDPTLAALMPVISDELTVSSNEPGASVFLRRYSPDSPPDRVRIGSTPIEKLRIARGDYVLSVEKEGFAPFHRTISGNPEVYWELEFNPPPTTIEARLLPAAQVPDNMVFVPGGQYRLTSWRKPTAAYVALSDFYIDRYEVSNREFKEFVTAGGYLKQEFWTYPVMRDGISVDGAAAAAEFKDRTGLPGPRSWSNQNFPEGRGEHAVTDISWYEAAAYAAFRGKSLPSIFQWEKAARDGLFSHTSGALMPWGHFQANDRLDGRANIASLDTMPVTANEFGMSAYGCYNMAGNAAEWCVNETNEGYATAGGSWGDPQYTFGSIASFPALFASNKLGFRCVKNTGSGGPDQAKIDQEKSAPVYRVTTAAEFDSYKIFYRYDKHPTNATVTERVETADWVRERIEYLGAGDEKALAYLYLPKNAKPPYHLIAYMPAGDVYQRFATVPRHVETFATSQIKAGRAVLAVVLRGFLERDNPPGYKPPAPLSVRFRDELVGQVRDIHRGLDYAETRDDIDMSRVAFWGYSAGAENGIVYAALEPRFKAVILMAVGIWPGNIRKVPEANVANFAPHLPPPKLVISGRYDEQYSWKMEIEPLMKLLREPKELVQYDAGHTPPPEIAVPAISKWLDERLGPVRR